MTDASIRACGTVLAEANATPIGWRSASPDLGSGRCMLATIESTAHQNNQDQISAKEESLWFEGVAIRLAGPIRRSDRAQS
jgi:hypothetical protein